MQPVFQDPGASFNPRQTVRRILLTPLEVHGVASRERAARLDEALGVVGLAPALLDRYPHQLSGGQKQRVAVARAVVLKPSLLLLDEPTSALDVSVQAQVLNLFQRTKRELGLTCLFVSHNLAVIRYVSDRVAVMRHGRLIEEGPAAKLFDDPQHSYTQALLRAVPDVARGLAERRAARQRQQAQGAVP
jgi:ABC-type glutathione transport system ATPase component